MEISQANIKNCPVDTKTKLVDDLFRLLQVRDKNQEMAKDWLLFISTAPRFQKLTPGEIYLAFQMAVSRELVDDKGNGFEMLPELSNNTTGKVLDAYIKFKKEDVNYNSAKDELKKNAQEANTAITDEKKAEIREIYLLMVFHSLKDKKTSFDAWQLYDEIESRLKISTAVKKRLYRIQEKKYRKEVARDARDGTPKFRQQLQDLVNDINAGVRNNVVQNRCRSIVVSNYLKKHLTDFETFKKAINET